MNRIRKGDRVIVTTGKNKGQTGEVLRVAEGRVVVAGLNMVKRHTKPNPQANQPGGIVEREASIHNSNVQLVNPAACAGSGNTTVLLVVVSGAAASVQSA